jgi:hypothetical protein
MPHVVSGQGVHSISEKGKALGKNMFLCGFSSILLPAVIMAVIYSSTPLEICPYLQPT